MCVVGGLWGVQVCVCMHAFLTGCDSVLGSAWGLIYPCLCLCVHAFLCDLQEIWSQGLTHEKGGKSVAEEEKEKKGACNSLGRTHVRRSVDLCF